ncbi:MAG: FtsW/RodA/SpoVE family cell cycle protein [Oscillospiraceae bacterium]|nr:FtsW/RodA/SpoVE family cell cycle protein [Oscillospiraceae bacterium]
MQQAEITRAPQAAVKNKKQKDPNRIRFFSIQGRVDMPMTVIILVLLVFGITMMFSAGHAQSYVDNDGDSFAYTVRQVVAAGIGLLGMLILCFFDYRILRHEFRWFGGRVKFTLAHLFLFVTLVLNFMCIFGVEAEAGQKRWLQIPVFGTFQPSDFLKISLIIFMSYYIHKNADNIRRFHIGILKPLMLFVVVAVIMIKIQSHLSGMLIMTAICAVILFVGGINMKPVIPVVVFAAAVIIVVISLTGFSYFGDRVMYMDPLSDPGNKSFQNYESALAIGSGGIWGKGFGNSTQKYHYLPFAVNDFVYSILVEEFGFVGGMAVIILFVVFVMRGFVIASHAEDRFGCLVATGITFHIGLQALLNIGVCLCCIPNTGISMPFFSYGGTALMLQLWEMGILLSISKRAKLR